MTPELEHQIQTIIERILQPATLIKWMEQLDGAERVGRIKRSKLSTLRYGLARYVQSQLPDIDPVWRIRIHPYNDVVVVHGQNPTVVPHENWELQIDYPEWLAEFFDDPKNFDLLRREDNSKLEEVLQRIFEWCYYHPDYHSLVETSRIPVESH